MLKGDYSRRNWEIWSGFIIAVRFVLENSLLHSESVLVDQDASIAVLLQPQVCEVLGKPARRALSCKVPLHGGVNDRDAKLCFDRVQETAYGIGMDPGRDVERLESPFDVLERRLDDDSLPRESSEP